MVGGEHVRDGVLRMNNIVEKPGREHAPSDRASVGGYLFGLEIFGKYLEVMEDQVQEGEEFQIQPVIQLMMNEGKQFFACELNGSRYYDTGNKLEYLKTVIDFALQRKDIGEHLKLYLQHKVSE